MKVAVSFLKTDNYKKCINSIESSEADYIHVDMCDGKYVREKNLSIKEFIKLLNGTSKKLDVHLMCKEPINYINDFALLNTETITFHPLSCKDVLNTINYIKSAGLKVGLAVNPNEKIDLILPYIDQIDEVLVMGVTPGKGGQVFNQKVLYKFNELAKLKEKYNFLIAVDGGINDETLNLLKEEKIDLIISGSYITDSDNYNDKINIIKNN